MKFFKLILGIILPISTFGQSINCPCSVDVNPGQSNPCTGYLKPTPTVYTLSPTSPGEIYIPNASARPWKGGDTLKIPAGSYSIIELSNFKGDPCNKIVIINSGGKVTSNIIRMKNDAAYFKITGSGSAGIQYGFLVSGSSLAMALVHDVEVERVEMTGGSLGFSCRPPDPVYGDLWTYAGGYEMSNIYFHDNYIHDIAGEGAYVGHSSPGGVTISKPGGGDTTVKPVKMKNVEIAYNIVTNTDWDGIQLSNAQGNAKIHHNTVTNYGRINLSSQQAGLLLGGATQGDIYFNTVTKGTGNGIQVFGYGTCNVYNNRVDSTGTLNSQQAFYSNDYIIEGETNPKQYINFFNNAINWPANVSGGAIDINFDNNNSLPSRVVNNTVCKPGAPGNWQTTYLKLEVPGSTNTNNTLACP